MDKLKSFGAAILIFIVFALIVNSLCVSHSLKTDHEAFSFWYDPNKDMSYDALAENMERDTILLMGSSEFRHGTRSRYHPKNLFAGSGIDLMTIGGPWNQTLFHTIAIGSLAPKLKSRKAILLVSPTWFKKEGVTEKGYATRFSETEYYNFMKNSSIPKETRKYVAKRTEKLLRKYPDKAVDVRLINRAMLPGKYSPEDRTLLGMRYYLARGRDHAAMSVAMRKMDRGDRSSAKTEKAGMPDKAPSAQEWDRLLNEAIQTSGHRSTNPFFMMDKKWKKKYRRIYRSGIAGFSQKVNADSPEFEDLKAFLETCRANGIEAKLIILPVNGRWYDFIGTTKQQRAEATKKIMQMSDEYGMEAADLTKYDYEEFMTRDAQHPWSVGWVLINREIYCFCKGGGHEKESS